MAQASSEKGNSPTDWNNTADRAGESQIAENAYFIDTSRHQMPLSINGLQQIRPEPMQPYQIVYVTVPRRSLQYTNYPTRHSIILGVLQIICGVACIVLGGVSIGLSASMFYVGHGFWGGISPIVAGTLGITSGCKKTRGMVAAHLVMSIIAASLVAAPFGLAITSAVIDGTCEPNHNNYYSYYCDGIYTDASEASRLATDILLVFFTGLEIVLAIWASGIGCQFCCCCKCCWSCCCTCYNRQGNPIQGNAVADMGLPTASVMQVQGHPGVLQYQNHPAAMLQLVPPSNHAPVHQSVAPPGYIQNASGYYLMQQPPSYSVTVVQPPPFEP